MPLSVCADLKKQLYKDSWTLRHDYAWMILNVDFFVLAK
jgi:hypothetical protein